MSAPAVIKTATDLDACIKIEEATGERHELVDGVVYAMLGGTSNHNTIAMNLSAALHQKLRGGPCRVFQQGMKLRIAAQSADNFFYPDVTVCCDPADRAPLWRDSPRLLAEVLSPSTERVDTAEKLMRYQAIPTLETYLIIHATRSEVWMHSKSNGWRREITDLIQPLLVKDLDLTLSFETLYDGVAF